MKRLLSFVLLSALAAQVAAPALAARRTVARHRPHRTTVVLHRGWPLRRPARVVVVHEPRVTVRVTPTVFLTPVLFAGVVIAAANAPAREIFVWEDSETLARDEDWTEFTLNCDVHGTKLWLEVVGARIKIDWAEVVFETGDTQVVDFAARTFTSGLYPLLDFRDGRKVDHVRMVARSLGGEARVVLRMER